MEMGSSSYEEGKADYPGYNSPSDLDEKGDYDWGQRAARIEEEERRQREEEEEGGGK